MIHPDLETIGGGAAGLATIVVRDVHNALINSADAVASTVISTIAGFITVMLLKRLFKPNLNNDKNGNNSDTGSGA